MKPSERLSGIIAQLRGTPPVVVDRVALVQNLILIHQFAKASENLLRVARDNAKDQRLIRYYHEHMQEETGHEDWLADDLATVDVNVRAIPVHPAVMEMVGSIYYMIFHVSSEALLGYMLVVEGHPTPMNHIEAMEELHGKPLLRTLRYHSENDLLHGAKIREMIDLADNIDAVTQAAAKTLYYMQKMVA